MNKKTLNNTLSWVLSGLFLLVLVSLAGGDIPEGSEPSAAARAWALVHDISGALLLAGSALHLALHWGWVQAVILRRSRNLAPGIRRDRRMDLWLGLCYLVCGLSGLRAWALPGSAAAPLHRLSGMLMLAMLIGHMALHRKWYAARVRNAIERRPHTPSTSHTTI